MASVLCGSPHIYVAAPGEQDWCVPGWCGHAWGRQPDGWRHCWRHSLLRGFLGASTTQLRLSRADNPVLVDHTPLPTHLWRRWGNNAGRRWKGGRGPTASVNFVTAHDGFTMGDLVAYNEKHNEANGENNRWAAAGPGVRQACGASPVRRARFGSAALQTACSLLCWC